MTSITINGRTFADPLGYISDHCHKFWIVRDANDLNIMNRYGWTRDDLNPIEKLAEEWTNSCPLRFIQVADLDAADCNIVNQFDPEPTITIIETKD